MKRIIAGAAMIGLLAVPAVAFAHGGADDTHTQPASSAHHGAGELHAAAANAVHQEDHGASQAVRQDDNHANQLGEAENENQAENQAAEVENEGQPVAASDQTSISLTEARTIAQSQFPSKTITKVEMETENGVQVFSVRFSDGSRVDVNSAGMVVRSEDKAAAHQASNSGPGHNDNQANTTQDDNDTSHGGHGQN